MSLSLAEFARANPSVKSLMQRVASAVGYDTMDWVRVVMYRECFAFIRSLQPEKLDVLEISAGPHWRREFRFQSYCGTQYPEFDVCAQTRPEQYDLIIADQIFEHLKWPYRAARNVHAMLRPGGYFLISVPFLIRVHKSPIDCTRWTKEGLSYFLQECGFLAEAIETSAWGNRACLKANLNAWKKRGFLGSLANEPDYPVMVWAFAQKTEAAV
jgi:SAM-dependent methyltransferase